MDLEKMLQEKAAARAAEKAENDAKAAQEQQDLEQMLKEKAAAKAEQEEQAKLDELQSRLTEFDDQITSTQELLDELVEVHDDARGGVEKLAEQKKQFAEAKAALEALLLDEVYKSVLAEEGITTIDELMAAEGFSETEQVKIVAGGASNVQSGKELLKEKIQERINTKKKAKAALEEEKPEITLTYNELIGGLEDRIEELSIKRKEVFWQTPEGQEAKQEEMKEVIGAALEERFSGYKIANKWEDTQYYGKRFKPKQLAEEVFRELTRFEIETEIYGTEAVESFVTEDVKRRIDAELDAQHLKKEGVSEREEALKKIEKLAEQWNTLRDRLPALREKEATVRSKLQEYLEDDGDEERKVGIANYYRGRYNQQSTYDSKIAGELTDKVLLEPSTIRWDHRTHDGRSLDVSMDKSISPQDYLGQCLKKYSYGASASYAEEALKALSSDEVQVPDVEKLLSIVDKLDAHYDEVVAFIGSEQDYGDFKEAQYKSANSDQTNYALKKQYNRLPDFSTLQNEVRKDREKLAEQKETVREQFDQAYGDVLVIQNESLYRQQNTDALGRIRTYERNIATKNELLVKIDKDNLGLDPNTRVEVNENGFISYEGHNNTLETLIQLRDNKKVEIEAVENQKSEIRRKGREEGDGLFGGKKKKREEELAVLDVQQTAMEAEFNSAKNEVDELIRKDRGLRELRDVVGNIKKMNVEVSLEGSLTAKEVISRIKGALEGIQLNEADLEIKKKSEELELRAKEANERTGRY